MKNDTNQTFSPERGTFSFSHSMVEAGKRRLGHIRIWRQSTGCAPTCSQRIIICAFGLITAAVTRYQIWAEPGAQQNNPENAIQVQNTEKHLPPPVLKGAVSAEEAISKRRSVRSFKGDSLSMEQLSQLLWAAQGITDEQRHLRTAPSAGATYPLIVYVATEDGLHRYEPASHSLTLHYDADIRRELADAAYGQRWIQECSGCLIFTAVYSRTAARYGHRAERYVHMEAGHAAQNVHIQAVALGLGSCPVGAFDDAKVGRLLRLPQGEEPLYIIPIGTPK